jgi:hypothetical protein
MDNNYSNLITIKFAQAEQPKFEENKGRGYVNFGINNDYPQYLIDLYNESPKHGAIIKGKTTYIYGKAFKDLPVLANSAGQSFNEILKKCILDDELFGGYYLQIIYNLLGKIKDVFHIDFNKVRSDKQHSEFQVKDDWTNNREESRKYCAFNPADPKGSQILFVRQYNPKTNVYPLPSYFQGLNYIDSDVQVSRHILGMAKHGFSATTLIQLNNGEPQEEQKEAVERGIKKKLTGSEGDRVVIMFNRSKETGAEIIPLGTTMLTKEDFTNINNLIQQEVFAAHQITSASLFGISTPGALGQRTEMQDSYEIFNNTYVNERQQAHELVFNKLFQLIGLKETYEIVPVNPLGFQLKEDLLLDILPREYFLDEMNIDQKYYNLPPARNAAGAAPMAPVQDVSGTMSVNENLAGMSGRKFQQLERIVRKYKAGKLTREQAAMMLKNSFGISDDEVSLFLEDNQQQFESQEEQDFELLNAFSEFGENEDSYEVIEATPIKSKLVKSKFAEKSIEEQIKKLLIDFPELTNVEIADRLNISESTVSKVRSGKGNLQIFLRYKYAWRDIVPADQRDLKTSRPFCQGMMRANKIYSQEDIQKLSVKLGYDVFERVGGWWTMPDGTHSIQCRHQWFAITVVKRK